VGTAGKPSFAVLWHAYPSPIETSMKLARENRHVRITSNARRTSPADRDSDAMSCDWSRRPERAPRATASISPEQLSGLRRVSA